MKEKLLKLMTEQYGENLGHRIKKLKEEVEELDAAYEEGSFYHLIDELADVCAVFTHIATIVDWEEDKLHYLAYDKIKTRLTNPNYKRL